MEMNFYLYTATHSCVLREEEEGGKKSPALFIPENFRIRNELGAGLAENI